MNDQSVRRWRHPSRTLSRLIVAGLLVCGVPELGLLTFAAQPTNASPAFLSIDLAQTNQTWEGFGASGAWWSHELGGWPENRRQEIIRLLFAPTQGLGLTRYRFPIGAGGGQEIRASWRRSESFEISPGQYDWSRASNSVRLLREIVRAGVTNIALIAYSPPPRLTRSGLVSGGTNGLANLQPGGESAFAKYLVDIAEHFREEQHIPISSLAPLNEPQWLWGEKQRSQEGCHCTSAEAARIVQAVLRELAERRSPITVEAVDSGEWSGATPEYARTLFADPATRSALESFSLHSYWSTNGQRLATARFFREHYPDKKLRMTEWCEMQRGRRDTIDSALELARTVQADLVLGGVVSWDFWLAVSKHDYADGLLYCDVREQTVTTSKRFFALGQFSRFIRPGFVRVNAQSPIDKLAVVVFRSPDSSSCVAVIINQDLQPLTLSTALDPRPARFNRLEVYQTTAQESLAQIQSSPARSEFTFPPRSITTLVWLDL